MKLGEMQLVSDFILGMNVIFVILLYYYILYINIRYIYIYAGRVPHKPPPAPTRCRFCFSKSVPDPFTDRGGDYPGKMGRIWIAIPNPVDK